MASRPSVGASWSATTPTSSTSACGKPPSAPMTSSSSRALPPRSTGGWDERPRFGIEVIPIERVVLLAGDAVLGVRPVGEPAVAGAIGQALDRRVAAETEILGAGGVDWPTASFLA